MSEVEIASALLALHNIARALGAIASALVFIGLMSLFFRK